MINFNRSQSVIQRHIQVAPSKVEIKPRHRFIPRVPPVEEKPFKLASKDSLPFNMKLNPIFHKGKKCLYSSMTLLV